MNKAGKAISTIVKHNKIWLIVYILYVVGLLIYDRLTNANIFMKGMLGLLFVVMLYLLICCFYYLIRYFWITKKQVIIKYSKLLIIGSLALLIPILINECYKLNCGYHTLWTASDMLSFYGSYLSFIGTFSLGYIVFKKGKDDSDVSAIKNGKILCSVLDSIDRQTREMQDGEKLPYIKYDIEWKKYYFEFEGMLYIYSSDCFRQLESEFGVIDKINIELKNQDYAAANNAYKEYVTSQLYSLADFNMFEVKSILSFSTISREYSKKLTPWKQELGLKKAMNSLSQKYFNDIENWILAYMKKENKKEVDIRDIEIDLVNWLLNKKDISDLVNTPLDRRIVSEIILEASLNIQKNEKSKLKYEWNIFSKIRE